jgi:hypothetical protein
MLICCPAVLANTNNLILWYLITILGCLVVFSLEDNIWRNCPACRAYALDNSYPLTITWLYSFWSITSLCACNDYLASYNPYLKACLIKIEDVLIGDSVFLDYGLYKLKLSAYNLRVFTLRSTIIVRLVKAGFDSRRTCDEVGWPVLTYYCSTTLS